MDALNLQLGIFGRSLFTAHSSLLGYGDFMNRKADPLESELLKAIYEQSIEALFEKDRLSHLGRIVKGLIHNVNGPLQNLSMLSELMSKGQDQLDDLALKRPEDFSKKWEATAGKQRQRFERLGQQIALLAQILRNFMVLLEIERTQTDVDLNQILEKMASVFQADLFFKHHVDVELKLEEGLPRVAVKGCDIVPALMHIFQNAITALKDASQKKLVIESLRESEATVRVVFRDSGCGFGKEQCRDDLFNIFCSNWPEAVSEKEKSEKHLGFGLYAVRKLLDPYGVKLRLERDSEETSAVLDLPLIALKAGS